MKGTTISVIIPTKDRKNDLKILLFSLSNQTRRPDEIIVVNNSRHGIKKTIETVKTKTGLHIKVVDYLSESIGRVRNHGIAQAKGDVLLFVDDDCVVPSNWVECMTSFPKKKGAYALVGTSFPLHPRNVYSAANNYFPLLYFENIVYIDKSHYYSAVIDSKNFSVRKKDVREEFFVEENGLSRDDFLLSDKLRKKGWMFLIIKNSIVFHKGKTNLFGYLNWSFEGGRKQYLYLRSINNKKVPTPKKMLLIRMKKKELIERLTKHYPLYLYVYFLILIRFFHPLAFFFGYMYELVRKKHKL